MNDLEKFVEKIIAEKGFSNLEPEVVAQIKSDLLDRVEDRINAMILRRLPPEKLDEFSKVMDQGGEDKIRTYCEENIPNLDEAVAAELIRFRDIYITA